MKLIELFKQPVLEIKLNENLKKISNFCLKIKKENKKKTISNVGGFQSNNLNIEENVLKSLIKNILTNSNIFSNEILKIKNKINISNIWVNINGYKDFNKPHTHPFSIISGVFYVKTPKNCGNIIFLNDSKIENYILEGIVDYNQYNSSYWFLPAKENTLYLFPSWLNHYVEPNLSNEERISISFNLN